MKPPRGEPKDSAHLWRSRGPISGASEWRIPGYKDGPFEHLPTCPLPMLPAWVGRLWELHRGWGLGVMLLTGGMAAQPCWYVQAMMAIDRDVAEFRAARWEREKPPTSSGLGGRSR